MKLGLWGARADAGGLAAVTHDFFVHMQPERTMVFDLGPVGRGPVHLDRYPGAVHSFLEAVSFSDVAQRALARSGAWLKGR